MKPEEIAEARKLAAKAFVRGGMKVWDLTNIIERLCDEVAKWLHAHDDMQLDREIYRERAEKAEGKLAEIRRIVSLHEANGNYDPQFMVLGDLREAIGNE